MPDLTFKSESRYTSRYLPRRLGDGALSDLRDRTPGTVTMITTNSPRAAATGSPRRWVQVGQSLSSTPRLAATEAAEMALAGADPKLMLVFAPHSYPPDEIATAVDEVAAEAGVPDLPVIGCSATGVIGPASSGAVDTGVVVVGFGGDIEVTAACGTEVNVRPRAVGEDVAADLLPLPNRAHHIAIMLTNDVAGDPQDLIRGAYAQLGAIVPLVGAVAGSGRASRPSWQIYNGKVLQDAVVVACLSSDVPTGISVRHGWEGEGHCMIATANVGNVLHGLDERPALDVFLARHRAPPHIEHDPAAFYRFALTRPLAISRRGELAVRHVIAADPRSRSLHCAAPVPKGAAVWFATTDVAATVQATDRACAEAVAALGETPPRALLVFESTGRRAVLETGGLRSEFDVMRRHARDAPIAGCFGDGEITRVRGTNGIHNQTLVACAMG
jgi:hypothetical protein